MKIICGEHYELYMRCYSSIWTIVECVGYLMSTMRELRLMP